MDARIPAIGAALKRVGAGVSLGVLALACGSAAEPGVGREPPPPAPPEGVEALLGLEFARPDAEALQLDLYRPGVGGEALPLVVFVFGGGWRAGHRHDVGFPHGPLGLAQQGFAVAAIDYRLSDRARFPAQVEDVKTALCWLRARAVRFGIDPERFGLWGVSAGAHLAALVGLGAGEWEGVGCSEVAPLASRVQAVVDFFGPTDLVALAAARARGDLDWPPDAPLLTQLLGGPVEERTELAALASPLRWVAPGAPPFLVVHGDRDRVVPLDQSERLVAALRTAGDVAELHVVVGGGHHRGGEFGTRRLFERVHDFFDAHLR